MRIDWLMVVKEAYTSKISRDIEKEVTLSEGRRNDTLAYVKFPSLSSQ